MSYFAVIREAGPAWAGRAGIMEQPRASDHAAFMNALAERGSVLFAGPLAGTEHGRLRALLIMEAESEAEVSRLLADDPWASTQQLRITAIEPCTVFVGAERLAAPQARTGAPA